MTASLDDVVTDLATYEGESAENVRRRLVRFLFGDPDDPGTVWDAPLDEEVSS